MNAKPDWADDYAARSIFDSDGKIYVSAGPGQHRKLTAKLSPKDLAARLRREKNLLADRLRAYRAKTTEKRPEINKAILEAALAWGSSQDGISPYSTPLYNAVLASKTHEREVALGLQNVVATYPKTAKAKPRKAKP